MALTWPFSFDFVGGGGVAVVFFVLIKSAVCINIPIK